MIVLFNERFKKKTFEAPPAFVVSPRQVRRRLAASNWSRTAQKFRSCIWHCRGSWSLTGQGTSPVVAWGTCSTRPGLLSFHVAWLWAPFDTTICRAENELRSEKRWHVFLNYCSTFFLFESESLSIYRIWWMI